MNTGVIVKIREYLSDPRVTFLILAITIGGRIIQLIFFYSIWFDGSYQVIATQNMLNGNGITTSEVFANDLSKTIFDPLVRWPPGYSLILAPFYALFNHHYIMAGMVLDALWAIVLIFTGRRLLKLLAVPLYQVNIYTLLTGFFIYYFYFIASSDAITITIFVVGLYFTLSFLKDPKPSTRKLIVIILLLFACASLKYLFIPVVFVIPAFLILKGISDKDMRLRNAGFCIAGTLLVAVTALLAWQKYMSGSATYISESRRGFYPEHLLNAYPFLPASFIKPDTPVLLSNDPANTGKFLFLAYQVLHLLLFAALLFFMIKKICLRGFRNLSLATSFFYISFLCAICITLLLAGLSLAVHKELINPGDFWTYIEDARYYGLLNVLLHMGVFIFYRHYRSPGGKKFKILFLFLLLLMLPEMIRGIIFDTNRILNYGKEEYYWQYEYRFQKYAQEIIKKNTRPGLPVIVTGTSHYMNNRVSLYSDIPVFNEEKKLNELSSLHTRAPVLLLVVIQKDLFPEYRTFLENRSPAGNFDELYFFPVTISPPTSK